MLSLPALQRDIFHVVAFEGKNRHDTVLSGGTLLHLHRFGEDFAVEGYVRDPYGE